MTSATQGYRDEDYNSDLEDTVRRPISVAQLLEREGYQAAAREAMARRTLTGVAAGAVLVFSAVVGGLLLHPSGTGANNTLASGAQNGDFSPPNGGAVPASSSSAPQSSAPTDTGSSVQPVANLSTTTTPAPAPHNTHGTGAPSGSTGTRASTSTPTQGTATQPTNPTSASSSPTTQSTTAPTSSTSSTSPANSSTSTNGSASPNTSTSANGGLLGTVGNVVSGVTQPVFNWFG